jgi:hypothetical protein
MKDPAFRQKEGKQPEEGNARLLGLGIREQDKNIDERGMEERRSRPSRSRKTRVMRIEHASEAIGDSCVRSQRASAGKSANRKSED